MSAIFPVSTNLEEMDCWPLGAFAPGGYTCTCYTCQKQFLGEKRAIECLSCSIKHTKKMRDEWRKKAEDVKEVPERIVAAAVFHGCTMSLPPPARHHTILNFMAATMEIDATRVDPVNQGFLTSKGRFVNRTEAYYIAEREKQMLETANTSGVPKLYSEDLW